MLENINENNLKSKKVTLESLAGTVGILSRNVGRLVTTVGDLSNKVASLDGKVDSLASSTSKGFEDMQEKFNILESGQENIKLRLDHVAYRFEVVDLKKRVERLEDRTGIS